MGKRLVLPQLLLDRTPAARSARASTGNLVADGGPGRARLARVGLVAIGRNEGERLIACIESALRSIDRIVYVDSGSTDDSVAQAKARGCEVVDLDTSIPFTAARARNAGAERMRERWPEVELVMFVDGDTELAPEWLATAADELDRQPEVAAVCGRLRERHPEASRYNQLCDVEWNQPPGDTTECGGNAMWRMSAYRQTGGFDPTLIAGEEGEFCYRVRSHGWKVIRIATPMATHDASMTRLSQWWRRSVRAGYSYTELYWTHRHKPGRFKFKEVARIWTWGLIVPTAMTGLAVPTLGMSGVVGGLGYLRSAWHAFADARRRGYDPKVARSYALWTTMAKLPEIQGSLRYVRLSLLNRRSGLIEHK